MNNQIRTKKRVKDLGEVFTAQREVNAMLDLIPLEKFTNPLSTWLEPACGNGNFLIEILARKLRHCPPNEFQDIYALKVVSSLYGVDIDQHNVDEAIQRLYTWLNDHVQSDRKEVFLKLALQILHDNIQLGDFLNKENLYFTQYNWNKDNTYTISIWPATEI
ncbi:DNA methyltransferase family protein [Burkholderia cenocepacia]|uniref:hypothetical protein n=1 Tax=Burkholderia cenocepacia TaxID=95486 RepID=UPI00223795A9|nr:hypothetical protein [Burkholderia cenocepacia]MCW5156325.1 hypothetical protein [Burkholderia cenocepacia]